MTKATLEMLTDALEQLNKIKPTQLDAEGITALCMAVGTLDAVVSHNRQLQIQLSLEQTGRYEDDTVIIH